ncbi:MAG TPA: AraC family transcriptional regulator [Polyangia bacterium]
MSAAAKYGQVLTADGWDGPAMRQGDWPDRGKLEALTTASDTILVWTGSAHEVNVHGNTPGTDTASKTFVRRGGMVDVMPAGTTLHEVTWKGARSTCVSVNFTSELLTGLFGANQPRLDPERGARYGVADNHVVDLVQRLQHQLAWGEPLGAAYVQGLSLTLASYVLANVHGLESMRAGQDPAARLAREAIVAFVEDNLGCNISLLEMAAVAGYSADHFARLFKRTFRVSPHQYILSRRIERAKSLLREPKQSLVDVALACGFSSQAHLNTMFKRSTGVTPGVYRRG